MSLRSDLAANRWMRAQFAVLVLAAVYVPVAAALSLAFGTLWALAPVAAYAPAGCVCWVGARRTDRALTAVRAVDAAKAAELHTPRVPDAGPDQCPVCGGKDLNDRAKDDETLGRDPDRCIVVRYGSSQRAHRDCAEIAPYVPTKAGREAERGPAIAFEVDGHPTYTGRASAERASAESALRLAKGATAGSRTILVDGAAPGALFLLQDEALRHMEIVMITAIGGGSRSGLGISVTLAAPLRHSFPGDTAMLPLVAKQLWHREEGRPYTNRELGMCDCCMWIPEPAVGKLRGSVDADAIAALFAQVNSRPHRMTQRRWTS